MQWPPASIRSPTKMVVSLEILLFTVVLALLQYYALE